MGINSFTPAHGQETLKKVLDAGGEGIYIQGDVSRSEDAERMVRDTVTAFANWISSSITQGS